MEIKIVCKRCGRVEELTVMESGSVFLSPCPDCMEKQYNAGRRQLN